ncbi:MAG: hypothetical protein LUQ20_08680 [Candidatus Methanoperedens sp.]|nr:hypothetical protein [Candidatus Methanoperedens sp.]
MALALRYIFPDFIRPGRFPQVVKILFANVPHIFFEGNTRIDVAVWIEKA